MQILCPNCSGEVTKVNDDLFRCINCEMKYRLNKDSDYILKFSLFQKVKVYIDTILHILLNLFIWIIPYFINTSDFANFTFDNVIRNCIFSVVLSLFIPIGIALRQYSSGGRSFVIYKLAIKGQFEGLTLREKHYAKIMRFFFFIDIFILSISLIIKIVL